MPSSHTSIDTIRSQFPALERRYAGYPVAYFDGPGGTQVPRSVTEKVTEYLLHHNANTHWEYPTSRETDEVLLDARSAFADYLGCQPDEVCFGANMTSLTFHLSRTLGREMMAGDEVIVTELDHHANIDPWKALEAEKGVVVRSVPMICESGTLDLEAFTNLLSDRTRLVAIGAASNAIGTINPVRDMARQAHDAGAMVFVDAVHYAAHGCIDVEDWDADFAACSAYKFYGPHIGVLFSRGDILKRLNVPKLQPATNAIPGRFETGTLNHEGIAGAAAGVDFLASLGEGDTRRARLESASKWLHLRGSELLSRLWVGLEKISGVTLFGPDPGAHRTPTMSFDIDGYDAATAAAKLAEDYGVFVSHGDYYASTVLERLGFGEEGLVRAGCACYTTQEEIDRLLEGVRSLADER